jgi:hypothetical protein
MRVHVTYVYTNLCMMLVSKSNASWTNTEVLTKGLVKNRGLTPTF